MREDLNGLGRRTASTPLGLAFVWTVLVFGASVAYGLEGQQRAPDYVDVVVAKSFSEAKPLPKLTDRLVCAPRLYHDEFFGRPIISAGAEVANPTQKKWVGHYHVALFDKDKKLVGCESQEVELEAGKNTQLGSCMIFAPAEVLKTVKYAQWRFYVSEPSK